MKKSFSETIISSIAKASEPFKTDKEFCDSAGITTVNFSRWTKLQRSPRIVELNPVMDYLGAQIVLPGETPDLRTFARMLALEAEDAPAHHMERSLDSTTPESVLEYVAAKRHNQPDMLFHPDYLKHLKLDAADGILYRVHNNALCPTICQGDLVLADRTQISIEDGALYLIQFGPSFALRYAARELGRLILYTSSSVPSQSLTPEQEKEIKILGRVVWVGKKL